MKKVELFVEIVDGVFLFDCSIAFHNWKISNGFDGTIIRSERAPFRGFIIECSEKTAEHLEKQPLDWMASVKRHREVPLVLAPE